MELFYSCIIEVLDMSFITTRYINLIVGLVLAGSVFCSCQLNTTDESQVGTVPIKPYDTSSIAVIPFEQKLNWPFPSSYKPATLSDLEILQVDILLREYAPGYNAGLADDVRSFFSIEFDKYQYKRQYIAVLNTHGEKEVWVNAFCHVVDPNWRSQILIVDDGGNCYFHLKVNLVTGKCFDLMVNGYA